MFGHYEDADLCLRSLQEGVPAWLQDVRFWHLEGKGSVRRPPHEGGSLVNRWLFTRRWGGLSEKSLLGGRHALASGAGGRGPAATGCARRSTASGAEAARPAPASRTLAAPADEALASPVPP